MNSCAKTIIALIVLSVLATIPARAETREITVDRIIEQANQVAYYQGADGRAKVNMEIKDASGKVRTRRFVILRADQPDPSGKPNDEFCGDQNFYVYFLRPSDVRKMVFLVHKHIDISKEDDRWLYVPQVDLVRRIAATDKRTSFAGSHFFYEDVSGRGIKADKHELEKTTKTYYVIKSTPKDPKSVEFVYYKTWIHRQSMVVTQTIYYDRKGAKYRQYLALDTKEIDGFITVTKSVMKDLSDGSETTLSYEDVKFNVGLPKEIFSEDRIKKAPRKYLK